MAGIVLNSPSGWQFALELGFIDDPFAEGFHGDFQRVMGSGRRWRHNTVNGGVDEAGMGFHPGLIFLRQGVKYVAF